MDQRQQKAQDLFFMGYNCSQSVAAAFDDITGFSQLTLLRLSASFGGGFGRLRELCGALSGAGLILGILYSSGDPSPEEKEGQYARVQEIAKKFEKMHGTLICRELLAAKVAVTDHPTPDPRTPEYYQNRPCPQLIADAVLLLEQYIAEHPPKNISPKENSHKEESV